MSTREPTPEERAIVLDGFRCLDCGGTRAIPYRVEDRPAGVSGAQLVQERIYDVECGDCGSKRMGA